MLDGTEIVSSLETVRDFVEEARISTDAESQQRSLRRAHAAVSKTERDYYALTEHLRIAAIPGSWRQRKVTMSEFNFYVLLTALLALLATLAFTNHFFVLPCAFWAVWIMVIWIRTRSNVKRRMQVQVSQLNQRLRPTSQPEELTECAADVAASRDQSIDCHEGWAGRA